MSDQKPHRAAAQAAFPVVEKEADAGLCHDGYVTLTREPDIDLRCVAGELGWPWKVIQMFGVLPERLLDRANEFVARNRYRAFGRDSRSALSIDETQDRLVD